MVAFGFLAPILGAVGGLLGKGAKGSADQRQAENQQALSADQVRSRNYEVNQRALMDALQSTSKEQMDHADFGLRAPMARGKQGLLASLMAGHKPATMSGVSPRLQQSMFSVNAPGIGPYAGIIAKLMAENAVKGLSGGDALQRTDFRSGVMAQPQLTEPKKAGLLEKVMGAGGLAGSLIGGVSAALPKKKPVDYSSSDSGGY